MVKSQNILTSDDDFGLDGKGFFPELSVRGFVFCFVFICVDAGSPALSISVNLDRVFILVYFLGSISWSLLTAVRPTCIRITGQFVLGQIVSSLSLHFFICKMKMIIPVGWRD